MDNENLTQRILATVRSHLGRVREGRELLKQGRPLSEMKTPLVGLTPEQLKKLRTRYLDTIHQMDDPKLERHYGNVLYQFDRVDKSSDGGTSELLWKIEVLRLEFGERHMNVPEVDLEKVRRGEYR